MSIERRTGPRAAGRREEGFALVGVLVTLILLSIVAGMAVSISVTDRRANWSQREGAMAHFAAEAGANQIWANWPAKADSLEPGESLDLGWTNLPDGWRHHGVIRRLDDGTGQELYVLQVEGRTAGRSGGQRVVELWASRGSGVFKGAIGSEKSATVENDAVVDSYDSSKGAYGGANVGTSGDIFSNGDIDIKNVSLVAGKAAAQGAVSVDGTSTVTEGTETLVEPREYPTLACPAGGYTPASSLPAGGYDYDEGDGKLKIENATLELPAGTYFFHDIVVSKPGSWLRSAPGATVLIYLDHKLHVDSEATMNQGGVPSDFMLLACGSDPSDWTLENNSETYAALYNPDKKVTIKNDSRLYGGVIGEEVVVQKGGTGPTAVHYDEQLVYHGPGRRLRHIPRAWAQIAR